MTEKEVLNFIGILFLEHNYIATDNNGDVYIYDEKPCIEMPDRTSGHWMDSVGGNECTFLPVSLPYCKAKTWDKTLRKLR